jgi:hypothetical protein
MRRNGRYAPIPTVRRRGRALAIRPKLPFAPQTLAARDLGAADLTCFCHISRAGMKRGAVLFSTVTITQRGERS